MDDTQLPVEETVDASEDQQVEEVVEVHPLEQCQADAPTVDDSVAALKTLLSLRERIKEEGVSSSDIQGVKALSARVDGVGLESYTPYHFTAERSHSNITVGLEAVNSGIVSVIKALIKRLFEFVKKVAKALIKIIKDDTLTKATAEDLYKANVIANNELDAFTRIDPNVDLAQVKERLQRQLQSKLPKTKLAVQCVNIDGINTIEEFIVKLSGDADRYLTAIDGAAAQLEKGELDLTIDVKSVNGGIDFISNYFNEMLKPDQQAIRNISIQDLTTEYATKVEALNLFTISNAIEPQIKTSQALLGRFDQFDLSELEDEDAVTIQSIVIATGNLSNTLNQMVTFLQQYAHTRKQLASIATEYATSLLKVYYEELAKDKTHHKELAKFKKVWEDIRRLIRR